MGVQAAARRARQAERQRQEVGSNRLPPWTPFQRCTPTLSPEKRARLVADVQRVSAEHGRAMTTEEAERFVSHDNSEFREMYQNSRYTVLVNRDAEVGEGWPPMVWLSIRRNDRERPGPERWRDFQRIKTELVGPENEAVELYPAESRVADCADQFHIFVIKESGIAFPFGFREGLRAGPSKNSPAAQTALDADG
jgi:hypothetical protein